MTTEGRRYIPAGLGKIDFVLKKMAFWMPLVLCILSPVSMALAQEVEPNDTCDSAQSVGDIVPLFVLDGNLDPVSEPSSDVDFFKFKFVGEPGAALQVDLKGVGTENEALPDPYLGLFNSACDLVEWNDDYFSLNSRLVFTVPSDGIFILAATACCDSDFVGVHDYSGTYQLIISRFQAIGSISGRVVDAVTDEPLIGDDLPYAYVDLLRCQDESCSDVLYVNGQPVDSETGREGQFQFTTDYNGQPLEVGTYQVFAYADQYEPSQTDFFDVFEGEDYDVGDIPLQPFPIQFSEIRPCENLPSEGGTCRYSVRVTNLSDTFIDGAIWSIVDSGGTGSLADYTMFQAGIPRRMVLAPGKSQVRRFSFSVPSSVKDGAYICTNAFFGQGFFNPFFDTLAQRFLFCIAKGSGEFSVMSDEEAQELNLKSNSRALGPPTVKGPPTLKGPKVK